MSKYYIRLNKDNKIVKTISDIFEMPLDNDILIGEDEGIQFRATEDVLSDELKEYAEVENGLSIINNYGLLQLTYIDGIICKVPDEILQQEYESLPKSEPTEIEVLKQENIDLMLAVTELYEMMI